MAFRAVDRFDSARLLIPDYFCRKTITQAIHLEMQFVVHLVAS